MATKTYRYSELADALISTGAITDMATDFEGWKRLALYLADLGEGARAIFDRISASASNYNAKQTDNIFNWALGHYDPTKSGIWKFQQICKNAGIDIGEYITDDVDALRPISKRGSGGRYGRGKYKKPVYKPLQLPNDSRLYSIPTAWVTAALPDSYERSPLARYLARKFGWGIVNDVFRKYYVGLTRKVIPIKDRKFLPVGSCIFPQIDEKGICRTAQIMAFDDEQGNFGHRKKDVVTKDGYLTWLHALPELAKRLHESTSGQWGRDENRNRLPYQCISGGHLLNTHRYPELEGKTIAVVESMSTALCMSCAMPEYIWLATAGSSCIRLLNDAVLRDSPTLSKRNIIVFPDEGKTDQWEAAVFDIGLSNVSVNHFMDDQNIHGGDIKDVVMSAPGTFNDIPDEPRREIETPQVVLRHMEEQHPIIGELVDKFSLEPMFDDCPF